MVLKMVDGGLNPIQDFLVKQFDWIPEKCKKWANKPYMGLYLHIGFNLVVLNAILHRQCLSSSARYTTMHRCSFGPDLVYVTITLTWCIILCWVIVIIRWYGLSVTYLDNAQFVTSFLLIHTGYDPRGNYMQTYLKKKKIWDQVLLERSSLPQWPHSTQNTNLKT